MICLPGALVSGVLGILRDRANTLAIVTTVLSGLLILLALGGDGLCL